MEAVLEAEVDPTGATAGRARSAPEQSSSMPLPGISTASGEMFGSWSLQSPPPKNGDTPSWSRSVARRRRAGTRAGPPPREAEPDAAERRVALDGARRRRVVLEGAGLAHGHEARDAH